MSKHEMVDNEIIEVVNYCAKIKSIEDCDKCPTKLICDDSNDERLISGVSNLINRLQKENKEKDEMLKAQADTIFLYERVIKDKNTAIERLKDKLFLALHTDTAKRNIEAEAIKKFVERLHVEFRMYGQKDRFNKAKFLIAVDNLVKEMEVNGSDKR